MHPLRLVALAGRRMDRGVGILHHATLEHLDAARALFGLCTRRSKSDANPLLGDVFLLRSVAELECEPESLPTEVKLVPTGGRCFTFTTGVPLRDRACGHSW